MAFYNSVFNKKFQSSFLIIVDFSAMVFCCWKLEGQWFWTVLIAAAWLKWKYLQQRRRDKLAKEKQAQEGTEMQQQATNE